MSSSLFKNEFKLNFQSKHLEEKYSDSEHQIIFKYSLWFSLYGLIVSSADSIYESIIFQKVEKDPKFKFIKITRITSFIITVIFLIQSILVNFIKNRKFQRVLIYFNYTIVVIPLFHIRTILYKQGIIEENLFAMIRTFELLERIILILLNLASVPNAYLMNFLLTIALWLYTPFVTGFIGLMPYASASILLTIFSYFYTMQVKLNFFTDYVMREHNNWYLNLLDHMNSGFISWSTKKIIFMNQNLKNLIQSVIDGNKKKIQDGQSNQSFINKEDVSFLFDEIKINNFLNNQDENFPQMRHTKIHNKNEKLLAEQILTLLLNDLKKNDTRNSNCTNFNLNEFMVEMKKLYFNTNFDQTFISIGFRDFVIEKELGNLNNKNKNEEYNYEVFMRCKFKETNDNSKVSDSNLISEDEEFEFIFIDITNTKMTERKSAELKYKAKFLSKIEHEFKNPLISITELTEQLKNEDSNPSDQAFTNSNYLKQIKSFCNYLLILIKDLNYFSLCNFGIEPKLENRETDLNEILNFCQDMAEILLIKYNKSKVKFKIHKNFQGAFRFMIDGTKLIQVLVNLISNSVKFTHKGVIDVIVNYLTTNSNEEFLEFQIIDTGIGISPERIKQIYKKPFIPDNLDVDNSDFSLGINFVNEILERFDSELMIESNSEGSTFSFSIKIKKIHYDQEHSPFNLKNKNFIPFKDFISNNKDDDKESISTRKLSSWEINLDDEIRQGLPSINDDEKDETNQNFSLNNNLNFINCGSDSKKRTRPETHGNESEISDMSLDLNTKFLIVVDDEKLTRMSTIRILTRTLERIAKYNPDFDPNNIKILESEDGIQCLYLAYNLLKKGYKNITIISDENMSHMNGTTCAEVLKNLKNLNVNQIEFILLSAYNEIKNAFLDYFISKPLSDAEAAKIISNFVGI
jgi:CheY-like chemotaxis protein